MPLRRPHFTIRISPVGIIRSNIGNGDANAVVWWSLSSSSRRYLTSCCNESRAIRGKNTNLSLLSTTTTARNYHSTIAMWNKNSNLDAADATSSQQENRKPSAAAASATGKHTPVKPQDKQLLYQMAQKRRKLLPLRPGSKLKKGALLGRKRIKSNPGQDYSKEHAEYLLQGQDLDMMPSRMDMDIREMVLQYDEAYAKEALRKHLESVTVPVAKKTVDQAVRFIVLYFLLGASISYTFMVFLSHNFQLPEEELNTPLTHCGSSHENMDVRYALLKQITKHKIQFSSWQMSLLEAIHQKVPGATSISQLPVVWTMRESADEFWIARGIKKASENAIVMRFHLEQRIPLYKEDEQDSTFMDGSVKLDHQVTVYGEVASSRKEDTIPYFISVETNCAKEDDKNASSSGDWRLIHDWDWIKSSDFAPVFSHGKFESSLDGTNFHQDAALEKELRKFCAMHDV